jgi:outer membrane protein assembly factor BamB
LRLLLAALGIALAFAGPVGTAARGAVAIDPASWTSYGFDNQLSNAIASKSLTPRTVPGLRLGWSLQLDGAVFASPLAASVDGRRTLFAATEAGNVYAVDARDGQVAWQRNLGMVQTSECGQWGITSTGAIDLGRHLLYEISADGLVHALDLSSGNEAPGFPVALVTNNLYEYVWGGLRIAGDHLYVVDASYCDVGPPGGSMPEGRMFSVPLDDPDAPVSWDPVPGDGNLGGMWGWGGVSVDPDNGTIYTGVGNSYVLSELCNCIVDNAGYGDSIVALAPDLSTVLDSDNPSLVPQTGDLDFGAAPLLFHPRACPPLAAMNNKDGALYFWDRTQLSKGPIARIPLGDGVSAFVGAPSWSESNQTVYVGQSVIQKDGVTVGNGVTAWHVDEGCGFRPLWNALTGKGNQATPLVVGNVVFDGGGKTGGFYAFNGVKGSPLWSYPTDGRTVASMISFSGSVYGADTSGMLYAFDPPGRRGSCSPTCFPAYRQRP